MPTSSTSWNVSSLDVALFAKSPIPKGMDVYSVLVGEAADQAEDRPKEGVFRQFGKWGESQLIVGMNPVRLDIQLTPVPVTDASAIENFPVFFGSYSEEIEKFAKLVRDWLPKFEVPVFRLSLLVTAVAEAEDQASSYKVLSQHFKSLKLPPNASDLFFRINKRVTSDLFEEGFLNRLTSWSAFKLGVNLGSSPNQMVEIKERFFARLDLDINTPAERKEAMSPDLLIKAFDKIIELANENISKGEV